MNRSSSAPLPPIGFGSASAAPHSHQPGAEGKENRELHYPVEIGSIGDLMGGLGEHEQSPELRKLQGVLHSHRVHLENVYLVSAKSRRDFADFCQASTGIDKGPANEIFSIATDRFAAEEDRLGHGADCTMSRAQFATAVVRLANLFALIQDGVAADSGRISEQVDDFLRHSK